MFTPLNIDVVTWAIARLGESLDGVNVDDETPPDLENQVPFVRCLRFGGGNDNHLLDWPNLAVHGFDTNQGAADRLTAAALQVFRNVKGHEIDGAMITLTRTISGPAWAPIANQNLRHSVGLIEVRIKPV